MNPTERQKTIRLLEKIEKDREMAQRLQISDASRYRREGIT